MQKISLMLILSLGLVACGQSKDSESEKPNEPMGLPKPIADGASLEYTKDQFPKLFEKWGSKWVKKISEVEKAAIHKIANTENSCDEIISGFISENKSIPKQKIVIFVDCANGERFYVEDSEVDTKEAIKSQTEKAISQDEAFDRCKKLVKANATYPSSVDFKLLDTSGFQAKTTGNVVVNLGFKAKNGFGVELDAQARCVFTPDGQGEVTFTEL
jgi:hypothetical protein